jgi:hypothetical protein
MKKESYFSGSLTKCQQMIFQKCWTTPEEAFELGFDIHILIGKLSILSTDWDL